MATCTSSASKYLSREKRQLLKKEAKILCQLEQVNLDHLSEGRRQLWRARVTSILGEAVPRARPSRTSSTPSCRSM